MKSHEKFQFLTLEPLAINVVTTVLGEPGQQYGNSEVGKAVKMANQRYVLCADGDEIEGFIDTIMTHPMGSTFGDNGEQLTNYGGGVAKRTLSRMYAQVASGAADIPLLGLVVAAAQLPLGAKGRAQVKAGSPTIHTWRVIRVMDGASEDTASAGDTVLIERSNA